MKVLALEVKIFLLTVFTHVALKVVIAEPLSEGSDVITNWLPIKFTLSIAGEVGTPEPAAGTVTSLPVTEGEVTPEVLRVVKVPL